VPYPQDAQDPRWYRRSARTLNRRIPAFHSALQMRMSLELPGRSDLATAPWPRDIGWLSARSLACFLPCAPCPGSLQGQSGTYMRGSRRARVTTSGPLREYRLPREQQDASQLDSATPYSIASAHLPFPPSSRSTSRPGGMPEGDTSSDWGVSGQLGGAQLLPHASRPCRLSDVGCRTLPPGRVTCFVNIVWETGSKNQLWRERNLRFARPLCTFAHNGCSDPPRTRP